MAATTRLYQRKGLRVCWEESNRIAAEPADAQPIARAVRNFVRAENFFDFGRVNDDCLLRSLALQRFLRGAGFGTRHVIGVRVYPFAAHAWVEHDGTPIFNELSTTQTYTSILAC